ncbi:hypothetical protein M0638_27990 [Roseomonas sp. NAR14]|uniref:Uncharacterized protein n=1 Tax=Roseomonas acroporae TaxID=2937791 RepID=A0A9X1YFJ0_9PROT|nr:hypothetical protein [Roseomonas acroporae]MCK8788195.1 hypothetical protein [Roseomonas acroporae]
MGWLAFTSVLIALLPISLALLLIAALYDPQAETRDLTVTCISRAVIHGAELPDAVRRCEALVAWRGRQR